MSKSLHDDVNEGVEKGSKKCMSSWHVFNAHPSSKGHNRVVIQVEERSLIILLAQNKDNRIQKLR
jgi:hypothetical protein